MTAPHLDIQQHPIISDDYVAGCREKLDSDGALVLRGFAIPDTVRQIVSESAPKEATAYYAGNTHNVYLTPIDESLPADHPYHRQVTSSKGLIADDEIPQDSPLRSIYNDEHSYQAGGRNPRHRREVLASL